MPELPEVEYTARQLRVTIVGATIRQAQVFWERTVGHPTLIEFLEEIAKRRIEGIRRRGKFLLLDLSGDMLLTIHRRMTGNLFILPSGWEIDTSLQQTDPIAWGTRGPTFKKIEADNASTFDLSLLAYCRVCFDLTDGRRLLFTDPRKFGRIELWPHQLEAEALVGVGIEPLSADFTVDYLVQALAKRKSAIKQVLLAQEVVAGIGNIYADEALFQAYIHPLRPASSLTPDEIELLHHAIVSVLTLGIEHGGTSFNDYRDLWGEAGDNYNHVHVYHQHGKPCPRCGTAIVRITAGQRSTHFCPTCQSLT
jgi:formamidopyrimidine-DNA glycosylase